tara:strand:- start:173 stop:889 length:717 start_codon:yes stop_codon:yes gene_type:complete
MNIFAIGDIHGCLDQLILLHKRILSHEKFDPQKDLLIYLGDYIDRGKNSKEVINQILKLKDNKTNVINLMGNHDEFMINFLFNKKNNIKNWLNFGADFTFRSYNIEIVEFIKDGFEGKIIDSLRETLLKKMGDSHLNFFKTLKISFSVKKYLFVHAGVNPQKKISDQSKVDLLLHRSEDFFNKNFKFEKVVVHGHTPEENIVNHPYRINIDTGCYFSGKLSCVRLNLEDNTREFLISN